MAEPGLYLKFKGLTRFYKAIKANGPNVKHVVDTTWVSIYAAFVRKRFAIFSRGGGDWPALALSTIKARRKGKGKAKSSSLARDTSKAGAPLVSAGGGSYAILRDTGLLFAQLAPQFMPVTSFQRTGNSFVATVTMNGMTKYPDGKVTVTDVIGFHNVGAGRLPKRKILEVPDASTKKTMGKVMARAIADDAKAN